MKCGSCKQCGILIVVVFVANWITNYIIHGAILGPVYQATAHLWRPEADMPGFMSWMIGGQVLCAVFFACIFMHGYKGTGWKEGARYGLLIGGLFAGHGFIMHAVSPYPLHLTLSWAGLGLAQSVIVGVVAAIVSDKLGVGKGAACNNP